MNTTWISHRGYKKRAVENTREAFDDAVKHGFSALETDLRLSRDGHIVLHHDLDLTRLAQIDTKIGHLTREELRGVILRDNGSSGSILFLDEFIRLYPGCTWIFDIKPEAGKETIRALYSWSRKQGVYDWICAQSRFLLWRESDELLLKSLFPSVICYARKFECWRAGLSQLLGVPSFGAIKKDRIYSVPPKLGLLNLFQKPMIEKYHKLGAKVLAFLPESSEEVSAALEAQVDEILTNGLPFATEKERAVNSGRPPYLSKPEG